jgi:hypothetical protein
VYKLLHAYRFVPMPAIVEHRFTGLFAFVCPLASRCSTIKSSHFSVFNTTVRENLNGENTIVTRPWAQEIKYGKTLKQKKTFPLTSYSYTAHWHLF